eukprot:m.10098 g.10098  ORF g.10098 m.10098 type:complete len:362 (+) comp4200_c0_seq2:265-1350(+)
MGNSIRPEPLPDILTGDLRRKKIPIDKIFIEENLEPVLLGKREEYINDLEINYGLFQCKRHDTKLYWNTIVPKDMSSVTKCMVIHHGGADNIGYGTQNIMLTYAKLYNMAVVAFDQPGCGRSDGLFMYISDWHSYVDHAVEFAQEFVLPLKKKWEEQIGHKLMMVAEGGSLGGGLAVSVIIKEPELYDAMAVWCPMLGVGDDLRPAPPVEFFARRILAPMFPKWCLTPAGKDNKEIAATDEKMVDKNFENPLGPNPDTKLRLQTAMSLAFQACDWIQANFGKIKTPFLVTHSKKDTVTDPALSQKMHDLASSEIKKIVLWEEGLHQDHFNGGPMVKDLMATAFSTVAEFLDDVEQQKGFKL